MLKLNKIIYYFCGIYKNISVKHQLNIKFARNEPIIICLKEFFDKWNNSIHILKYGYTTNTYFNLSDRKLFKFI